MYSYVILTKKEYFSRLPDGFCVLLSCMLTYAFAHMPADSILYESPSYNIYTSHTYPIVPILSLYTIIYSLFNILSLANKT